MTNYVFIDIEVWKHQLDYRELRSITTPTNLHPFVEQYTSYKIQRTNFIIRDFHAILTQSDFSHVYTFTDIDNFLTYIVSHIYDITFVSYNQIDIWICLYHLYHFHNIEIDDNELNIIDVFYKSKDVNPTKRWFSLENYHKFIYNKDIIFYKDLHTAEFDTKILIDVFIWAIKNNHVQTYRFNFT
jgi:hypothetical protein